MGAHFHEHHHDIVRWPWKVFCRKWARLLAASVDERRRELERKREDIRRRDERDMGEMRQAHGQHFAGVR